MLFRSLCFTASATIALTFFAGNAFTTQSATLQTNLVSDIPGRGNSHRSESAKPLGHLVRPHISILDFG